MVREGKKPHSNKKKGIKTRPKQVKKGLGKRGVEEVIKLLTTIFY